MRLCSCFGDYFRPQTARRPSRMKKRFVLCRHHCDVAPVLFSVCFQAVGVDHDQPEGMETQEEVQKDSPLLEQRADQASVSHHS
jgi:hypothetical protein